MVTHLVQHVNIESIVETLREQRIKRNTDYSVITKYGKVIVICAEVYRDTIAAAFIEHGVKVEKILTFNWDTK